jgi:hypothetical protein
MNHFYEPLFVIFITKPGELDSSTSSIPSVMGGRIVEEIAGIQQTEKAFAGAGICSHFIADRMR